MSNLTVGRITMLGERGATAIFTGGMYESEIVRRDELIKKQRELIAVLEALVDSQKRRIEELEIQVLKAEITAKEEAQNTLKELLQMVEGVNNQRKELGKALGWDDDNPERR